MDSSQDIAEDYLWTLCRTLSRELKDSAAVMSTVERLEDHAKGFPEVRFCKGCVLPVLDRVTTEFFNTRLSLSSKEAHAALRCEGASTLPSIYAPGDGQSGFSGVTWGTNHQSSGKGGGKRKSLPCPDFGVVHLGTPSLTILGETKYVTRAVSRDRLLAMITKDMDDYMAVERDAELGWHYEFGIGIAFRPSADRLLNVEVLTQQWAKKRYFIMLFHPSQRGE